ncbi:MAG: endonuclease/exonuclease/phosphatase family protein [Thermoguttaceae bacterium]
MKRRDALKGAIVGLCGLAAGRSDVLAETREKEALRLQILTFNIQIGRGPGGSYSDPSQAHLERTAAVIKEYAPDVAGLQEVDNRTGRSGKDVDQLGEIAKLTALTPTFVSKTELEGGAYGIGVLSKEEPLATTRAFIKGSAHRRVLEICEFERYYFFNTHFPLKADLRLAAIEIVNAEADKRRDKPIVFVGDLNAEPNSLEIKTLQKTWTQISPDAPTFPADGPKVQIDYIFARNVERINVLETFVVDDSITSDHRPVFASIEIPAD